MEISNWLSLAGGLALFLFGMTVLSDSLEEAAGSKLKDILEKLTNSKLKAVLVGIGVTAALQSSSAMTVMLIGFMNAGLMNLQRCIWVVMGSNIGTTITAQMIAINVGAIAPVFAVVGVFMHMFTSKKKTKTIGTLLTGFGVLFMGLSMMSDAMEPLQKSKAFLHLMTTLSNPLLAIGFATAFTALIQSSGAAIGILQTLAMKGLIPFETAAFMVCGLNIGTCITAVLASMSGDRRPKRIAAFHVIFNCIGTLIFAGIIAFTPILSIVQSFSVNAASQIANFHTIFNIATTFLLLPFDKILLKVIYKIIPERSAEEEESYVHEKLPRTSASFIE